MKRFLLVIGALAAFVVICLAGAVAAGAFFFDRPPTLDVVLEHCAVVAIAVFIMWGATWALILCIMKAFS